MHLRAVELRDWRSYQHARFEFPVPHDGRNVILIRAPNEFGKTSFFEAVTLGLFGREGLFLVPRARVATSGKLAERQAISYSQFLGGTLHRHAIAHGRQSCTVTLEFEDADGEAIEITRKWHFSANGQHKLYDDELIIFEGRRRSPIAPPAAVTDRDAWYRDYIARIFLPADLAEFFLFDGEQVQRYANRGMTDQIRLGIEGLLGLPVLRSLKESLQRYAQGRRSEVASPSDEKVKAVEADIARLEAEIARQDEVLTNANNLLPSLESEQEAVIDRLGGGGEATVALVADLMREEERFRAEAERCTEELMKLLSEDVSLALAGESLRNATVARLRSEETREKWESGRNQGNVNLDRYLGDLSRRLGGLEPPVTGERKDAIVSAARDAWHALWHPAPPGCADQYLHTGLMGSARAQAIERLEDVGKRSAAELGQLVALIRSSVETMEAKKRERLAHEQNAPEIERLSARLKELSEQIGELRGARDEAKRAKESAEGDLAARRQEFGRYAESKGRGAPAIRRASHADRAANLIDDILKDAIPTQVSAVAEAMTHAWKSMAQMSDRVDHIEITPDCQVRLLNAKGENLHEIEKSAGAS